MRAVVGLRSSAGQSTGFLNANWAPRRETARRIRSKSGKAHGAFRALPIPSQAEGNAPAFPPEGVETRRAAPNGRTFGTAPRVKG